MTIINLSPELKSLLNNNNFDVKNLENELFGKYKSDLLNQLAQADPKKLRISDNLAKFLAEILNRIPKKLIEPKHILLAGMLLKYIDVPVLHDIAGLEMTIKSFRKISSSKFYAEPFTVMIDNANHCYTNLYAQEDKRYEVLVINHCSNFAGILRQICECDDEFIAIDKKPLIAWLLQFPFTNKPFLKKYRQDYIRALIFLYASNEAPLMNVALLKLSDEDKVFFAKQCLWLLRKNNTVKFVQNIVVLFLDAIKAPLKADIIAIKKMLFVMRDSASLMVINAFGSQLAENLKNNIPYDKEILECVYDYRLGLHNFKHLDNQINRFNLSYKNIVPESMNMLLSKGKKDLACGKVKSEFVNQYLAKLSSLSGMIAEENNYATRINSLLCKPTQRAVATNIEKILTDAIANNCKDFNITIKDIVAVNDTQRVTCSNIIAKIERAGYRSWRFHEANLPSGYIIFNYKKISVVAKYLLDMLRDGANRKLKSTNLQIKEIGMFVSGISRPKKLIFRSITPTQMIEPDEEVANTPLRRSLTAPGNMSLRLLPSLS